MRKSNPKIASRYFPSRRETIDTVREMKANNVFNMRRDVLTDAYTAWNSLEDFRREARRNKMYTFGDQWGDMIDTPAGRMTEKQSIIEGGNIPLQNNRIRGIVRSVCGVFMSQRTEPVCVSRDRDEQENGDMISTALQYVYQLNRLWGLDGMNLNVFLVSGLAAFKSLYAERNGKQDVWTDQVNYNYFFFDNHMQDPRHTDCHLVGQIHDIGLYDVINMFAASPAEADRIREIYRYANAARNVVTTENLVKDVNRHLDFFLPTDETRCRVIEVWKKESRERYLVHDRLTGEFYRVEKKETPALDAENERRIAEQSAEGVSPEDMKLIEYKWFVDNYWYFYYLSPQGEVLQEGETPFAHKSHPYAFRVYPFYDRQIFPFVSDFIDQQRYINHLIILQDLVIRNSSKGLLAIHADSMPENMTPEDVGRQWVKAGSVLVWGKEGKVSAPVPEQISSQVTNLGVTDMLSIQFKLLEDISGVHGALQGSAPPKGTPASLYMQQVQNSTASLTEIFESYRELREERDMKNVKLIQQFYTEARYLNIAGDDFSHKSMVYDPAKIQNAEFDLSITESASTPAARMVMNDFLMQIYQAGQISLLELLENGAFPFSDKLIQSVKMRQEQIRNGTADPSQPLVPEDIRSQIYEAGNPIVQQMFNSNSTAQ